jgi:hypothetical protein
MEPSFTLLKKSPGSHLIGTWMATWYGCGDEDKNTYSFLKSNPGRPHGSWSPYQLNHPGPFLVRMH